MIDKLKNNALVGIFLKGIQGDREMANPVENAHSAVFNGDKQALIEVLAGEAGDDGLGIDFPHPYDGRRLLHSAVQGRPSDMIEYLVAIRRAQVDSRDNRGQTPLLMAAASGSPRNITRLIALGANEKAEDIDGFNAVSVAARYGHVKTVVWLITQARLQQKPANDGRTALHLAAYAGRCHAYPLHCMLHTLVAYGADIEAATENGFTPIHSAAVGNQSFSLQRLHDMGAQLNPQDRNGITPLMIAASFGHVRIVEKLIALGASVTITDNRGYSAFHFACEKGHIKVVDFLFAYIPVLTAVKDSKGRRRRATLGQHMTSIVTWFTKDGVTTPFKLASRNEHFEVVDRLNMAKLVNEIPTMPENKLMMCLDLNGVPIDRTNLDISRVNLILKIKKSFQMDRVMQDVHSKIPLY